MVTETAFFRRVNPAYKFLIFFIITLLTIFLRDVTLLAALSGCALLVYLIFSPLTLKWKVGLLLPFVLLAFFSGITVILFGLGDDVLFQFLWWRISSESLAHGTMIILRTLFFSLIGLSFATTTNPVLFFYSAMQQFKVPTFIAYSFLTVFRLIPIMAEEITILNKAMRVRGVSRIKGPWCLGKNETLQHYHVISINSQSLSNLSRHVSKKIHDWPTYVLLHNDFFTR
ncbi:cobalt ABC transporter permease CbiQ [Brochothrix thermosphacta DSM 20171 = FSL F6-1036]|nr:cobalt ABC transporter permease CbiQ [Brochothrix thermosphacta DSM 20171 = FSL F6-1036]